MEIREKHNAIPWKEMAGMRDILVHAYFRIDSDIVWKVVKEKLPEIKEEIKYIY